MKIACLLTIVFFIFCQLQRGQAGELNPTTDETTMTTITKTIMRPINAIMEYIVSNTVRYIMDTSIVKIIMAILDDGDVVDNVVDVGPKTTTETTSDVDDVRPAATTETTSNGNSPSTPTLDTSSKFS